MEKQITSVSWPASSSSGNELSFVPKFSKVSLGNLMAEPVPAVPASLVDQVLDAMPSEVKNEADAEVSPELGNVLAVDPDVSSGAAEEDIFEDGYGDVSVENESITLESMLKAELLQRDYLE